MPIEIPNNEQLFMKLNDLEIKLNSFKAEMDAINTNLTKITDRHDVHIAKLMAKIQRIEDDGRLTPTYSFASDETVDPYTPRGGGGQRKKKKSKKGKKRRTNRR